MMYIMMSLTASSLALIPASMSMRSSTRALAFGAFPSASVPVAMVCSTDDSSRRFWRPNTSMHLCARCMCWESLAIVSRYSGSCFRALAICDERRRGNENLDGYLYGISRHFTTRCALTSLRLMSLPEFCAS